MRRRGLLRLKPNKEGFKIRLPAFHLNKNTLGRIQHPARQFHFRCNPVHEGSEADSLHCSTDRNLYPLNHCSE